MAHVELGIEERRRIERLRNARVPVMEIADELGRHRSTIYREIKRNRFIDEQNPYLNGYYSSVAQMIAGRRRFRRRKLVREPPLLTSIVDRLRAGWSPEQIAGRLRKDGSGSYICHETRLSLGYIRMKDGNGGSHAFCHIGAKNAACAWTASRARLFFHRTARSIEDLTTSQGGSGSGIGRRTS